MMKTNGRLLTETMLPPLCLLAHSLAQLAVQPCPSLCQAGIVILGLCLYPIRVVDSEQTPTTSPTAGAGEASGQPVSKPRQAVYSKPSVWQRGVFLVAAVLFFITHWVKGDSATSTMLGISGGLVILAGLVGLLGQVRTVQDLNKQEQNAAIHEAKEPELANLHSDKVRKWLQVMFVGPPTLACLQVGLLLFFSKVESRQEGKGVARISVGWTGEAYEWVYVPGILGILVNSALLLVERKSWNHNLSKEQMTGYLSKWGLCFGALVLYLCTFSTLSKTDWSARPAWLLWVQFAFSSVWILSSAFLIIRTQQNGTDRKSSSLMKVFPKQANSNPQGSPPNSSKHLVRIEVPKAKEVRSLSKGEELSETRLLPQLDLNQNLHPEQLSSNPATLHPKPDSGPLSKSPDLELPFAAETAGNDLPKQTSSKLEDRTPNTHRFSKIAAKEMLKFDTQQIEADDDFRELSNESARSQDSTDSLNFIYQQTSDRFIPLREEELKKIIQTKLPHFESAESKLAAMVSQPTPRPRRTTIRRTVKLKPLRLATATEMRDPSPMNFPGPRKPASLLTHQLSMLGDIELDVETPARIFRDAIKNSEPEKLQSGLGRNDSQPALALECLEGIQDIKKLQLHARMSEILSKHQNIKSPSCCPLCCVEPSDMIFHPCGHRVGCFTCLNVLLEGGGDLLCLMCRGKIGKVYRVDTADGYKGVFRIKECFKLETED